MTDFTPGYLEDLADQLAPLILERLVAELHAEHKRIMQGVKHSIFGGRLIDQNDQATPAPQETGAESLRQARSDAMTWSEVDNLRALLHSAERLDKETTGFSRFYWHNVARRLLATLDRVVEETGANQVPSGLALAYEKGIREGRQQVTKQATEERVYREMLAYERGIQDGVARARDSHASWLRERFETIVTDLEKDES